MTDDLFERLRAVDPATEERITQETRALGNTPGRIVESEPSNVRRFPKAARRKATLAAVAAVAVLARSRSRSRCSDPSVTVRMALRVRPGPPRRGDRAGIRSVALGRHAGGAARAGGVTYVPHARAFVFVPESGQPYAEFTLLGDDRGARGERVLFCERTERFLASRGDVVDRHGAHRRGERGVRPRVSAGSDDGRRPGAGRYGQLRGSRRVEPARFGRYRDIR